MWGRFTKSGLQLESVLQETLRTDVCKTWVSAVAFLVSSHSWTTDSVRSVSPGLKTKGLDCCWVVHSAVMFSDESKFCISFGNQGPRVWRKRGEAQNPRCLRSSVKFPQSVMVWGAMSSAGVGPLCFLRSKVNTAVYQEVLEHFMLPAADQRFGEADFFFQQDLAPAHSAKATSTWFKDHCIPVLNWLANSPDLNPIENLLGIVKRKMRYARPNYAEELKATIRATWALITPEQCHRLIDSMPRRIAAVIQAKGAPTKYWVLYMLILFSRPSICCCCLFDTIRHFTTRMNCLFINRSNYPVFIDLDTQLASAL